MSDVADLKEQAKRCRRLADGIDDPRTIATLRQMAEELERRAAEIANEIPPPKST